MKSAFERIHNINPTFNRIFSVPLYLVSIVVVLLFLVSPYYVRVGISLLINLCFNRPMVYLNYLARLVVKPLNAFWMTVFYAVMVGAYSVPMKIFGLFSREKASSWAADAAATDRTGIYYQS